MATYAIHYTYTKPPTHVDLGEKHKHGLHNVVLFEATNDDEARQVAMEQWKKISNWKQSQILDPKFLSLERMLDWQP